MFPIPVAHFHSTFLPSVPQALMDVGLLLQRSITELQQKLQERATNLQTAVCRVIGKEEVNKAMAARAQVSLLPFTSMLLCDLKALSCHTPLEGLTLVRLLA